MGCKSLYNCCFVECCFQDVFNTTRSTLVQNLFRFFSNRFFIIRTVPSFSWIDNYNLGKIPILFYQRDQISVWLINSQKESTFYQYLQSSAEKFISYDTLMECDQIRYFFSTKSLQQTTNLFLMSYTVWIPLVKSHDVITYKLFGLSSNVVIAFSR